MNSNWKNNGPVVIGGLGGSGTRLIAEICRTAGFFLGGDLNIALDNLSYTFLFRRYKWIYNNRNNSQKIQTGLSLLEKMILKHQRLSLDELIFLCSTTVDYYLHYRKVEKNWSFDRVQAFLQKADSLDSYLGWGWKEPNSYILLPHIADRFPNLKFIHTIRHGLDMAFSRNQRQMKNWGSLYFDDFRISSEYSPTQSLKFWIAANQFTSQQGESLGSSRYLMINFDDLCVQPEPVIDILLQFLQVEVDKSKYQKIISLPKPPESLGRYKNHDLSIFKKEDLKELENLGFSYEI